MSYQVATMGRSPSGSIIENFDVTSHNDRESAHERMTEIIVGMIESGYELTGPFEGGALDKGYKFYKNGYTFYVGYWA